MLLVPQYLKVLGATESQLMFGCITYLAARIKELRADEEVAMVCIAFCRRFLESEGYSVNGEGVWDTQAGACKHLEVSDDKMRRELKRWIKLGRFIEVDRGPSGRVLRMKRFHAFDVFVCASKGKPHTGKVATIAVDDTCMVGTQAGQVKGIGKIVVVSNKPKPKRLRKAA